MVRGMIAAIIQRIDAIIDRIDLCRHWLLLKMLRADNHCMVFVIAVRMWRRRGFRDFMGHWRASMALYVDHVEKFMREEGE